MTTPFRSPDATDILDDDKYRLTKERLDDAGLLATLVKCLAILLIVTVLVSGPSSWIFKGMPPLAGASLFLLSVPLAIWMARSFETEIRGEVVSLHGALYPRVVAVAFPWFFMKMALTFPGGGYSSAVVLVIGLIGAFWSPTQDMRPPAPTKLGRWIRKFFHTLQHIPGSIWLQIVLFGSTIKSCIIIVLYLLEFTAVYLRLSRNGRKHRRELDSEVPDTVPSGNLQHFSTAHVSDPHFMGTDAPIGLEGRSRNQQTFAFLQRHGREIANSDLIAVTGDITDTGFRDEWMEADKAFDVLASCRTQPGPLPCAIVPGNHDLNIFASFDRSVDDLGRYQKKLALLGVSNYANRGVRLIRYLAFWDKWSGTSSTVHAKSGVTQLGRAYLSGHAERLNTFATTASGRQTEDDFVTQVFDQTFPSVMTIKNIAKVYTLDSNARTWHVAANSLGMFGIRQLWRLWRLLGSHPKGQGAVFLLHHHVQPGIKKAASNAGPWYQRFDEYSMATVDSFLFCWILERRLKQAAIVLHGHTHHKRDYQFGRHRAICAPSTGYGEGSEGGKANRAFMYEFGVDCKGKLVLTSCKQMD